MSARFFLKKNNCKLNNVYLKGALLFLTLMAITSLISPSQPVESKVIVSQPDRYNDPEKKDFDGKFFPESDKIGNASHLIFLPFIKNGEPPPSEFNKNAPGSGTTEASLSPVLSWNISANATRYEYCYDTTNDGACGTWTSTGTNNYAGLRGLESATTYYWQVRSWNGTYGPTYANGSASAYWSFTTMIMTPGAFNKHAPANGTIGATLSPVLSWNVSNDATRYEYCFDTTNDGNCSSWISAGTNNYAGLRGLEPATMYYWQVRSWNGTYGPTYANGSASAYWSFTTMIMTPGAFNKHAPTNGTTGATLSPVLSWNVSNNATKYEYCFDTTNDGNCSSWISAGTNNYAGLRGLEPATTYYWQVRSWNGTYGPTYANGSANAYWSLTTLASDVWIMDNCSFTENRAGTYQYITCEMYNNTSASIKSVKLYVDLYDSDGTLIGTDFAYTLLDLVHPQETACVRISFSTMTNLSYYYLYRSYSIASNEWRPPLAISNHSGSAKPYGYEVLGIITNNSQATLEKVRAVDTLYDSGGLVIGCDYAYINQDPANLAPGQQSSFRIYTLMKDPYLITRYKLQADGKILTINSGD
ncbi:MAG TPA: FxLYD domain-containing protein [Anaerolineaceae bacterium]|nr:FxLYD domain-containing protein [Anaerolineaceae bacterium]